MFTDLCLIDESNVPFLTSLPQMKNLGIPLDLRRTQRGLSLTRACSNNQGYRFIGVKQGTLLLMCGNWEFCRRASTLAKQGRQLDAASSFPVTVNPVSPASSVDPLPNVAAGLAPQLAIENSYRQPKGQNLPPAFLHVGRKRDNS